MDAASPHSFLPKSTRLLVLVAIALMFTQLLVFWTFAQSSTTGNVYYQGVKWDSYWYQGIATKGYYTSIPPKRDGNISNVAFFPGYPLLARGVSQILHVHPQTGLLVVAQVASIVVWIYVLLFLRRWNAGWWIVATTVGILLTHPVAFLLVCAYSESLFLAALLGFLYWSIIPHRSPYARALAIVHGFVLSATRILGLPLVLYPLFDAVVVQRLKRRRFDLSFIRSLITPLFITSIAVMGGLFFLLYCKLWFGHWDLYMQTQSVGWGFKADYWRFIDVSLFKFYVPKWDATYGFRGNDLNNMAYPFTILLAIVVAFWEWRWLQTAPSNTRERIAFYTCALLMVYIGITSRGIVWERNAPTMSMVRFTLPAHVLVLLAVAQRMSSTKRPFLWWQLCVVVVLCLLSLQLQGMLTWQFIHPNSGNYIP